MRRISRWALQFLLFLFLTVATQIGGIILLFSLAISVNIKKEFRFKKSLIFIGIYLIVTLALVPIIAPLFGREKVDHSHRIRPTTYATVLLNRNYVKPRLNALLQNAAKQLKGSSIELRYLDASFPFFDGFPLIPHLSHDDGEKIDLSFVYTEPREKIDSHKKKSISGYGVFEGPIGEELDQIKVCKRRGYWHYDYARFLTFGSINDEIEFSIPLNQKMINVILNEKLLGKLFIEPHLRDRLNLKSSKVRFHGCQAVRHDDHVHLEL